MNKIILFFIFLIFSSFKASYCKLSDKIYIPYNKELKKQKGLYLAGSGGAMMNDIQKVNAHYVAFKNLSIKEARRLYVEVVEGYLTRYNQNEPIRPYLHTYPFTVDNIEVMIAFENETGQRVDKDFVALMFIGKKQRLIYETYDHEIDNFIRLYAEPYETARDIVMAEKKANGTQ